MNQKVSFIENRNFTLLCIVQERDADFVKDWYQENSDFENKLVFAYENASTYLREYEAFKTKHTNIFLDEVFEMPYFMRMKILHDENSESYQLKKYLHFDLFYAYIKRMMDEKKYALAIDEIQTYFCYLDDEEEDKKKKSLLYTKLAKCMQHCEYSERKIVEIYEKAYFCDHHYLVPLYELIVKYRLAGLYQKGIDLMTLFWTHFDGTPMLFNDSPFYDEFIENVVKKNPYYMESLYTYLYFLEFETIICYLHIAEASQNVEYFKIAYQLCNRVMLRKMVIADEAIKQINHFKARCIEHVKGEYTKYNREKVEELMDLVALPEELKRKEKGVIFTVTTCKRFDLFEQTMNALLNCTKDIDMIQEWLCVDDNSSEEDRALMKERYPFFTFIWKGPEEKGHAKSMNIIRDYVLKSGYPYTMHMEDDWVAVCEMEYVKPSIRIIMENQEGIRQVVQNRQYVQLIRPRDIDLKGGFQRYLKDGFRYIVHEFYPKGSAEENAFWKRNGGGFSASYWPHYSLNPSVMSCEVYQALGPYPETVRHFEMDYASRYTNAGFRTAFLDGIFRLHIGKLIGEEGKKNAYELNELVQF